MSEVTLENKKEILEVRMSKIRQWRKEYLELNDPSIPDLEYAKYLDVTIKMLEDFEDSQFKTDMFEELNTIEFPVFADVEKIKRDVPMLSINNVFTFGAVYSWMQKIARDKEEVFKLYIKYDGMAGKFVDVLNERLLITRGSKDGYTGQNISRFIPIIELDVCEESNFKDEIDGELIITKSKFDEYNSKYFSKRKDGKYKTPRSMVQALLNTNDVSKFPKDVKIDFVEHSKYYREFKLEQYSDELLNTLIEELQDEFKDYPNDGIVIGLADKDYFNTLGHNEKFHKGNIAYKFEQESYKTKLVDVVLQRGKHILTPVAKVATVNLKDGTQIRSPSFRNAKILKDFDVHIGDWVYVEKRAEVNPFIIKTEPGEKRIPLGDRIKKCGCPENSDVIYKEPYFYCSNPKCNEGIAKNIYECCRILEIEDIGLSTISKIVELYELKDFVDLITLDYQKIRRLPGFGEIKATKIFNNLQKSKTVEDYKVLACLGIRGIGVKIAKEVCKRFTLKEVHNMTSSELELAKIPEVGKERSFDIVSGLTSNFQLLGKIYNKFDKVIVTKGTVVESKGLICFTGEFPKTKSFYEDLAMKAGYTIAKNYNKGVKYLVSAGPITSKVQAASKNKQTNVIKLEEFLNLIK